MISSSGGVSVQDMTSSVFYVTDVSFTAICCKSRTLCPFFVFLSPEQGSIIGEGALTGLRPTEIFLTPPSLSIQIPGVIVGFVNVEIVLFKYWPLTVAVARLPAIFLFLYSLCLATF